MAVDRPDDIGEKYPSDSVSLSLPDVQEGRLQINYGTRPPSNNFNPFRFDDGVSSVRHGRYFIITAELDNSLVANEITRNIDGSEVIDTGVVFLIAKPYELRRDSYDETDDSDGFTRTYDAANRRKLTNAAGLERHEVIAPAYNVNDRIHAFPSDYTGVSGVNLIDVNTAGREWRDELPRIQKFAIKSIEKDHFNCYYWIDEAEVQPDEDDANVYIKVAKPEQLRGSFWDDITYYDNYGNITFTNTDATSWLTRTATRVQAGADPTENHVILPPYLIDSVVQPSLYGGGVPAVNKTTILTAIRVDLGVDGSDILWQDMNVGAHAWAQDWTGSESP